MNRRSSRFFLSLLYMFVILGAMASCAPTADQPVLLAAFKENDVDVAIQLERAAAGGYFLSATFTPPAGFHMYSKDIPRQGVGGLGRPTLLELGPNSRMKATGGLLESAQAQESHFEPRELLVYPEGAITLRLPVELPPGRDWVDDEVQVSYMACSPVQCKPPVAGKVVSIRIPGSDR